MHIQALSMEVTLNPMQFGKLPIRKETYCISGHTERKQIWSKQTVQYMRSLLKEVVRNGTGRGIYANSSYIGVKTGTTNEYRDFWFAGLSNEYTVAVWIGYDQPTSMLQLEDDRIHFNIFNRIINQ